MYAKSTEDIESRMARDQAELIESRPARDQVELIESRTVCYETWLIVKEIATKVGAVENDQVKWSGMSQYISLKDLRLAVDKAHLRLAVEARLQLTVDESYRYISTHSVAFIAIEKVITYLNKSTLRSQNNIPFALNRDEIAADFVVKLLSFAVFQWR